MEFNGKIKDLKSDFKEAQIILSTPNKSILEGLEKLKLSDKELTITIKKKSQQRSLDANAYSWYLMHQIGNSIGRSKDEIYLEMLERYGVFTHIIVKPTVVEKMKEEWRLIRELGEVKINGQTGIQLQCYFGSSTYTTAEMSNFINGIVSECKEMGIETLSDKEIKNMEESWRI